MRLGGKVVILEFPKFVYRLQIGASDCVVLTDEGVGLEKSIQMLDSANFSILHRDLPVVACMKHSLGLRG